MPAIDIYAITNSSDEEFPDLLPLRHVIVELHPRGVSRPLVGSGGIYLIGIRDLEAKRIFISHNPAIAPTTKVLGPLESACVLTISHRQFGTMASFSYENQSWDLVMATYDMTSYPSCYRWLRLNILEISNNRAIVKYLAELDDNVGRLVIRRSGADNHFLVMDVIWYNLHCFTISIATLL